MAGVSRRHPRSPRWSVLRASGEPVGCRGDGTIRLRKLSAKTVREIPFTARLTVAPPTYRKKTLGVSARSGAAHAAARIYDTAVFFPVLLRRLVEDVGAGHVVLGTDHPFELRDA